MNCWTKFIGWIWFLLGRIWRRFYQRWTFLSWSLTWNTWQSTLLETIAIANFYNTLFLSTCWSGIFTIVGWFLKTGQFVWALINWLYSLGISCNIGQIFIKPIWFSILPSSLYLYTFYCGRVWNWLCWWDWRMMILFIVTRKLRLLLSWSQ